MSLKPLMINIHKPSNEELRTVIQAALEGNFKTVVTDVRQCPDLSADPFHMTSTGFGRKLVIADVGGPGNLFPIVGRCCEMVADANFASSKVATKIASIPPEHNPPYKMSVIDSSKFSLMANLAISGEPGPAEVIHVKCSVRTGKENFPEAIRKGLAKHFGEKTVSIAGIFIMQKGEAKLHVMPDFPCCPFKSEDEIDKWLQFFTMKAPLVCASAISSEWNTLIATQTMETQASHYHYDTTPDIVEYEGWFTAAEKLYRIDEV
ncbi:unnamed protein product [Nippostrongylus brasiliensis]|uniref:DUF1907 domain-containing protein n=1 Tax=Nippostrongylus brasiliensis TaxID=27835 RepID=A0A158QZB5_NIPBR|nr:unnamed protein product [Nippostrongylus brasiliensis]